ncbi:accessory Sec system translocase SecA2 [Alkaliphilus peptidifermentans]|uniref:Protein translocase subunit SecA n=1 Tax=Alkaliphilus peptidifermentans DSM 18978 TaxID=1120976 RepID=A0A1G5FZG3_9FIRM|nr:accessory Sec system translocase SecA2 [Alkaliphilus peptidifermentans]SCY44497.1 preprotein translocase subunit SecA [Alkaliphilus peptidifermentans DSM 18978]
MQKKLKINNIIKNIKNKEIYNIEPYRKLAEEISGVSYKIKSDLYLKKTSENLRDKAKAGIPLEELIVEAYALAREASNRVIGMKPYDVQIIAAIALHQGRIIEMQTGEGKTLSAVMPAYLNALTGKGVHILTFNDYLAERDAKWMGPVYDFLGLSCGYIKENMSIEERKEAYLMDITYVTAKEAGFDYLRDFLATEVDELTHRPFNYAIVDEADSILIDEARIPLVIAGSVPEDGDNYNYLAKLVKGLRVNIDYETDQYNNNISLTEKGQMKVEKLTGCGNLYAPENLQLLTKLNCVLYAEKLLKKEVDYIVRKGKIEIIDELTGRVADKRHWPDNLHGAVEAKEGLISKSKGMIMGSIALQYFLRLYPRLAGMTGTAVAAINEFAEMYRLEVAVIPTNRPCIRKDHPDLVFTHEEAKERALISEILRVNSTGQPILIAACSVEESEKLSEALHDKGIKCNVLNAKNDFHEAKIIAEAGSYGAVTVSTNLAGRGVDIKLGGEKESDKEKVAAKGGLYVIGTGRHESSRIDNQLRGRAGRQGDPGESRFFISLEDDFIKKYEIDELISDKYYPQNQNSLIADIGVLRKLDGGQRIAEGYNSDIRRQLWKYSYIIEEQRRIIWEKRYDILMDRVPLTLLSNKCPELYLNNVDFVGRDVLNKVEKQITLFHINKSWAEYLDYVSYIREGIHLVVIGGEDPLHKFHVATIEAFKEMMDGIEAEIIQTFTRVNITSEGIDLQQEGLKGPSSTWTYLVSDNPDKFSRLPFLIKSTKHYVKGTLFSLRSIYEVLLKRIKKLVKMP